MLWIVEKWETLHSRGSRVENCRFGALIKLKVHFLHFFFLHVNALIKAAAQTWLSGTVQGNNTRYITINNYIEYYYMTACVCVYISFFCLFFNAWVFTSIGKCFWKFENLIIRYQTPVLPELHSSSPWWTWTIENLHRLKKVSREVVDFVSSAQLFMLRWGNPIVSAHKEWPETRCKEMFLFLSFLLL